MSGRTGISRPRLAALALLLAALSACGDQGPTLALIDRPSGEGFFSGLSKPRAPDAPLTEVALGAGAVRLVAPQGWCIEPESLQTGGQQGFALLVGCRALTEGESGDYSPSGVLTVAVSRRRTPGEADAVEALRAAVQQEMVRSEDKVDGVALMRLRPRVTTDPSRLGDPVWRAVFVHQNRAISLAAYGPEGGRIAGTGGASLLLAIAKGIRGNSRE
ncbi:hypothetical protein [Marinovum sp.]|uniref:hypothetical protein n=1 Tax=Marinovum sp. TaxID=2024839 RepID=UPI002B268C21|nr:hypothetical protein [Marinovum sp.]